VAFTNPARRDGLVLHHWRRQADEGKDYPFAKFNKSIEVPAYTEPEYQHHLVSAGWSRWDSDNAFFFILIKLLKFLIIRKRYRTCLYHQNIQRPDLKLFGVYPCVMPVNKSANKMWAEKQ
jgi:hypothetical protein